MNFSIKVFRSAMVLMTLGFASFVSAETVAVDSSEITNDQMVEHFVKGDFANDVKLIDSRPTKKFNAGHIPGAINLPLDVLKKEPAVMEKIAPVKTAKTIFYCAGRECTLSVDSAEIFKKDGYTNVLVYRNGIPGWNEKAQPLLAEEAFIKKGNLIIIDLDTKKKSLVAKNNTTVQISFNDLKGEKGKKLFGELSKNAPIVVLSRGDMTKVNNALEELRFMDFRRLSYFDLKSWKEALGKTSKVEKLSWAPVYEPGQISPKAFEVAVETNQYILDVRPAADFSKGHFKGAVNLPIEKMEAEFSSIPKGKDIFINCATGAKSQKAYDILTRKGYTKLNYLDAEISCKDSDCKIKE